MYEKDCIVFADDGLFAFHGTSASPLGNKSYSVVDLKGVVTAKIRHGLCVLCEHVDGPSSLSYKSI